MKKIVLAIVFFVNLYSSEEVKICDDIAEWPPFTYYKRINNKVDKSQLEGATVELVKHIFDEINMKYSISLIPWKRCTSLVDKYNKAHKYEMFLDATYTKERAQKYYITLPIYSTQNVIWFSKKKYTKKELLNKIEHDVNSIRFCDAHGYEVEKYYKVLGVDRNISIDVGAKDQCAVLRKISLGRCDAMVASKVPIFGYNVIGKCNIPKDITFITIDKFKKTNFYIFIAKTSPRGKQLLEKINKAIIKLKKDGTYKRIFSKYLPSE